MLRSIAPFFIVDNLSASLDFYCSRLGFHVTLTAGGDDHHPDFFGIVQRDDVMIILKQIAPDVHPHPNSIRHKFARWDAYIHCDDPDSLFVEYLNRSVPMHNDLADTEDGLRGFEVSDNNGYVLCFARPLET